MGTQAVPGKPGAKHREVNDPDPPPQAICWKLDVSTTVDGDPMWHPVIPQDCYRADKGGYLEKRLLILLHERGLTRV